MLGGHKAEKKKFWRKKFLPRLPGAAAQAVVQDVKDLGAGRSAMALSIWCSAATTHASLSSARAGLFVWWYSRSASAPPTLPATLNLPLSAAPLNWRLLRRPGAPWTTRRCSYTASGPARWSSTASRCALSATDDEGPSQDRLAIGVVFVHAVIVSSCCRSIWIRQIREGVQEGEEGEEGEDDEEEEEEDEGEDPNAIPDEQIKKSPDEDRFFMHNETMRNKYSQVELDSFMKLLNVKPVP